MPHVIAEAPAQVPLIAVPTTAGTGSEMTRVTVITDPASSEKMLLMGPGAMPNVALVASELTHGVPFRLTADTGVDAFTHALEAYVSAKRGPYADALALAAMRAIAASLRTA